jgi:hypothetical protein
MTGAVWQIAYEARDDRREAGVKAGINLSVRLQPPDGTVFARQCRRYGRFSRLDRSATRIAIRAGFS